MSLDLFDPPAPSKRGAIATSAAQGERIAGKVCQRRYQVIEAYARHLGALTADEVAGRLREPDRPPLPLTWRPRCSELVRVGWLRAIPGVTRPSIGGGRAAPLELTAHGRAVWDAVKGLDDPATALEQVYRSERKVGR